MKKVLVTAVLLIGVMGFSQRSHHSDSDQRGMKDMSPEQIATLKTKKMTLALDLNEAQKKEIQKIILEDTREHQALILEYKAKREGAEKSKPSAVEYFTFQNERLDRMIAQKGKMKQILSEEQFQKWERMHPHQRNHGKDSNRKNGSHGKHGK